MKTKQRTLERVEPRHLIASDWQNASLIRDVDNSSLITPLDALLIINNLNGNGSRELMPRVQHTGVMSYDVNADNYLTPLDVLVVINAINSLGNSQPRSSAVLRLLPTPNNNGFVLANNVTIEGQTFGLSSVGVRPCFLFTASSSHVKVPDGHVRWGQWSFSWVMFVGGWCHSGQTRMALLL